MAMESGFFNSKNGDRKYNARDISRYFEHILSSGLYKSIADCMKVTAAGGMNVQVAPGAGLIDCQWFRLDTPETLTIGTANAALPRVDAVVVRLDMTEAVRAVALAVVAGTPGAAPVAPTPTRTDTVKEYIIAHINVAAGISALTESDVEDTRDDADVCGWVESLVAAPVLKAYQAVYTATKDETKEIPINIAAYSAAVDLVAVYVNGWRLEPGTDYTLDAAAKKITLTLGVDAGTRVMVEALKPTMPDDLPTTSETVVALLEENTALKARLSALEAKVGTE